MDVKHQLILPLYNTWHYGQLLNFTSQPLLELHQLQLVELQLLQSAPKHT